MNTRILSSSTILILTVCLACFFGFFLFLLLSGFGSLIGKFLVLRLQFCAANVRFAASASSIDQLIPQSKDNIILLYWEGKENIRKFNVDFSRRTLAVIKGWMVIELEAGLHAIELLKFDKAKSSAFGVIFLLGCDAHGDGGDFGEMLFHRFGCSCVRKVS